MSMNRGPGERPKSLRREHMFRYSGVIELVSGCRIGGSDDILQIGGTDLTCIKDPASGRPYLPGSSIKGKMRSELEKQTGTMEGSQPSKTGPVARVFGPHFDPNHNMGPTRIRVHDAFPLEGQLPQVELKTESVNNRQTGTAQHPRTLERVVPGVKFRLEIDIDVYDIDKTFQYQSLDKEKYDGAEAIIQVVLDGLTLLERSGLGSGTSRGSGQIRIIDDDPPVRRLPPRKRPPLDDLFT